MSSCLARLDKYSGAITQMMTRFLLIGWLLSAVCLLQGCRKHQPSTDTTVVESQYRPATCLAQYNVIGGTELRKTEVKEVHDTVQPQAEALLQDTAAVPPRPQQAIIFTNRGY